MDKTGRKNAQKVAVAMSGGVDSSVAAALLKKEGFDVVGVFMKFWTPFQGGVKGKWNRCCSPESEARARKVAKILGIPFYVFNFEKEFKKRIVDCFLKENKEGLTPNPCVVCNKEIKFGLFLKRALKLGAGFIATGHYARVKNGRLLAARDKNKDQSYFLWRLSRRQLEKIIFPVGKYTRQEVEKTAERLKLPFAGVSKSQEICFVPKTVEDFLRHYLKLKPGRIADTGGNVLAEHEGLCLYTIGQRKGIGLSGGPYYVLAKDFKRNILVVTRDEEDLLKKELIVKNVHWISGKGPVLPLKVNAKIRYRQRSALATIVGESKPGHCKLLFSRPQRAVTPGQSVVFYRGQEVLGGGIISGNKRSAVL
jgi:tRNA-specific 2-thiouridylase